MHNSLHTYSRRAVHLAALGGAALGLAAASPPAARAQSTFTASLTGAQETPPNTSTGFGTGLVVLNAAQTSITVDLSWTSLTGGATVSHIHGPAAPGVSAPVLFPFTGVPNTASGVLPEQTFAITPRRSPSCKAA